MVLLSPRFDGGGFPVLADFLVCRLSALPTNGQRAGWNSDLILALLAAATVAFELGLGIYGTTYVVPFLCSPCMATRATRAGVLLMPAGRRPWRPSWAGIWRTGCRRGCPPWAA
jgi:hypothetical protein